MRKLSWQILCKRNTRVVGKSLLQHTHDVIDRALPAYGGCCILRLYNEYGRELDSGEVIENARVYMVKRVAR